MEIKYVIALALIAVLTVVCVVSACLSQRMRALMFFLLVGGAVLTERMDVNFFSLEWYRGTTRGIEISLIDIFAVSILAASLLAPRYQGARWYWPVGLSTVGIYLIYCCFSVLISEPKIFGVFELSKLVRGLVIFLAAAMFIRTSREVRLLVLGLTCAVFLEGVLGLRQRLMMGMDRVAGSLDHANSLSMYLCLVTPVLVAAAAADFPRWVRTLSFTGIGVAACTMMLTISRAGIPMFALVVLGTAAWAISWRITLKKIVVGMVIVVAAGLLIIASWRPLMARYDEASLKEEYLDTDAGNEGRGVYLRLAAMIVKDHFFGLGLNNWSYGVSKTYGAREGLIYGDYDDSFFPSKRVSDSTVNFAAPAHNLGALTLGELGVPGLALFALLWLRWFYAGAQFLRRRVSDPMHLVGVGIFFGMCGIFLQSLTEWVSRQTPIFITFYLLVGTLAGLCYHKKSTTKIIRAESATVGPGWMPVDTAMATAQL